MVEKEVTQDNDPVTSPSCVIRTWCVGLAWPSICVGPGSGGTTGSSGVAVGGHAMTGLEIDRPTRLTASATPEVVPGAEELRPVPAQVSGVRLTRLLALAALTPAQAAEVGAGLLAALEDVAEGSHTGDVVPDRVRIGVDGRVVLAPRGGDDPAAADCVAAVLATVAACARERAGDPDPTAARLLDELDCAAAHLSVTGAPVAAMSVARRRLAQACTFDRVAVRSELGALVRALGPTADGGTGAGPVGAARERPPVGPPGGRTRTAGRRAWAWVLSIAVLVGVVALEVALLRDDIVADVDLLLDAGRSGTAPSAAPEPDGLPITPPAPAAAGSVAGVDLRPLETCRPGEPCSVRVLVRLVPASDIQTVTWSYLLVDRCTGATDTAPGGTVIVPPETGQAAAVGTVALPPHPAVAVLAVTDRPAVAAGPPLLTGSCRSAGSTG
jgi:hypothetical protein